MHTTMSDHTSDKEKGAPAQPAHIARSIISFMEHALELRERTAPDPAFGAGSLLYALSGLLKEEQKTSIMLSGFSDGPGICCSVSEERESNQYDLILANPPFALEGGVGRLESMLLSRTMDSLTDNGRASVIMPYGFLSRQSDAQIRKRLYETFEILSIFLLPSDLFDARVNTCILTFQKSAPSGNCIQIEDYRNCRDKELRHSPSAHAHHPDVRSIQLSRDQICAPHYFLAPEKYGLSSPKEHLHSRESSYEQLSLFPDRDQENREIALDLFRQMFLHKGFPVIRGRDLFQLRNGAKNDSPVTDGPYPVIGANRIYGYTDQCNLSGPLPAIVISRVGEYCGHASIMDRPAFVTDNAIYISMLYKEMDLNYLCYLLNFMDLNQFKTGSGNPYITQRDIYEREYIFPPLDLQTEFSDKIRDLVSLDTGGPIDGERQP